MTFTCPYNEGITNLAVELIRNGPEWIKHYLEKYEVVASILEAFYQVLVNHNEIQPIEKLEQLERQRFWNMALEIEAGRKKRIKIAKAYYLIEKIS